MNQLKTKSGTNLKLEAVLSLFDISQDVKLICFSVFLFFFGDGLFTFLLPVYLRQLNALPIDVGMLYAAYYLSWGITILLGGFLADRFDLRKIMILSSFLYIPVPLALAFATNWQQLWLPMILYGTFFEAPSIYAYLIKSSHKVMQAFGALSVSAAAGYVFSPAIGGILTSMNGKQTTFLIATILYGASIMPLFLIKKQTKLKNEEIINPPQNFEAKHGDISAKMILLCCFFTVTMFFIYLIEPLIPQFVNGVYHQSLVSLGVFGTATSVGWIVFSTIFGKTGDKHPKMASITASIIIASSSFLVIVLFNNFLLLCIASFLYGAARIIGSFMSGVVGTVAPKRLVGRWTSISNASVTIAGLGAPILGGELYQISPYCPFLLVLTISPVLVLAAIRLMNKTSNWSG